MTSFASPYWQHALAPSGERIDSEAQQTVSDQAGYGKASSYTATTREIHAASTTQPLNLRDLWATSILRPGCQDHLKYKSRGF